MNISIPYRISHTYTLRFLNSVALKWAFILWTRPLSSPETHIAEIPTTILDWCNNHSFIHSFIHSFSCVSMSEWQHIIRILESCISLGLCNSSYLLFCEFTSLCKWNQSFRKENHVKVSITIMNSLKDTVTKIHSVSGIMWLQFMQYYCLKWF